MYIIFNEGGGGGGGGGGGERKRERESASEANKGIRPSKVWPKHTLCYIWLF